MSPRRPQEDQNEPQEGTKGAPGPPKRDPKEPPRAPQNRSAQKYRKIRCFILENRVFARFGCIFEAISSAKPVFFLLPARQNTVFYEAEGGPKGQKPENMRFRKGGRFAGRLAFFGGSGPRKITKNSVFTREVWQKLRES